MEQSIANHADCDKSATVKRNQNVGIILGCQRMNGNWQDVCAMARNGYAVIRDGLDVRLIWSGAFETEAVQ